MRQQKNKWKKDTKAIKSGVATLQDIIVEEPKPKQMKVNLTFTKADPVEEKKASKPIEEPIQPESQAEDAAPNTPIRNKRKEKQACKEIGEIPSDPVDDAYYVEFNLKQQRNVENCIIGNQIVVTPERLICLSNIRVKDLRLFVYYQVRDRFALLDPSNIELAYRFAGANQVRQYISLAEQCNLTIDQMI